MSTVITHAPTVLPQALEDYAAARLPRVRDVWVRPPGAFEPPNRLAAIKNASFTPLGPGLHSGKSRPLPGWQPAPRVEVAEQQPQPQQPQQPQQQVQQKAEQVAEQQKAPAA